MRILIVSYFYAPDRTPRAFRWSSLAEYWAGHGHEVTVISGWKPGQERHEVRAGVQVERVGGGIIETLRSAVRQTLKPAEADGRRDPAPLLHRFLRYAYGATWRNLYWPDHAMAWRKPAVAMADTLIRSSRPDMMVTVSHPFTSHLVGLDLKRRFPSLGWLADIGDPFSFFNEIPLNNTRLYGWLNRRAEAHVLRAADRVAVTVEGCREAYNSYFPGIAGKVSVIPPLLSLDLPVDAPSPSPQRLVYAGSLYAGLRDPAPFLALVEALAQQEPGIEFHLYGHQNNPHMLTSWRSRLGPRLKIHGQTDRAQIADALSAAGLLVNIGNTTTHQLPSKVVEYMSTGRPILNIAAHANDTSALLLASYPSALTVIVNRSEPDGQIVETVLAFMRNASAVTQDQRDRLLSTFRLDSIARNYLDLICS